MYNPESLAWDPVKQRLFVWDINLRILVYNLWGGVTNGMNASQVLGQPDFTTSNHAYNPEQNTLGGLSFGMSYDATTQRLFVADFEYERVEVFDENDLAGTPSLCPNPPSICGTVTAAENSSALANVPVELLDAQGSLVTTANSHQDGTYSFGSLTANATYYIVPVVGRTMSATPLRAAANPSQTNLSQLTLYGPQVNLQIRGWLSPFQVTSSVPGATVFISAVSYNGDNAPSLNPNSSFSSGLYSANTGSTGSVTLPLPDGTYYVTCWIPTSSGGSVAYRRSPANGSFGPSQVFPNSLTQPVLCN
jgi:hypothetical protein